MVELKGRFWASIYSWIIASHADALFLLFDIFLSLSLFQISWKNFEILSSKREFTFPTVEMDVFLVQALVLLVIWLSCDWIRGNHDEKVMRWKAQQRKFQIELKSISAQSNFVEYSLMQRKIAKIDKIIASIVEAKKTHTGNRIATWLPALACLTIPFTWTCFFQVAYFPFCFGPIQHVLVSYVSVRYLAG